MKGALPNRFPISGSDLRGWAEPLAKKQQRTKLNQRGLLFFLTSAGHLGDGPVQVGD